MTNHKVIVIAQDFNHFDSLHDFLTLHDIDYQSFETFNHYIAEHDYCNHILIADAIDINLNLAMDQNETVRFNRKLYNCTYIIAYEHSNCTDALKKSLLSGADDYLSFPYDAELTCLKIAAAHRHMKFLESLYQSDQTAIVYNHLSIDPFSKQIFLKSQKLDLTHSEFNILYTLAKNPNEVFNMEYLFQMITGQKSLGDYNALMTHVSRLRKKMAQIDSSHHYILTVRNKGYKFNAHIAEPIR